MITPKEINALRDMAVYFENLDMQFSIDLISLASEFRPNGHFILNKLRNYSSVSDKSKDIEASLVIICTYLSTVHVRYYKYLSEIGCKLYPDNRNFKLHLHNASVQSLAAENYVQLEKKIALVQNKFNKLHEVLCYSEVLKPKELDDVAAQFSPIEILDKKADTTVLVFGGMATRPSMPPKEFFATFSTYNANIVFVKDFKQCWYQKGLLGITQDVESTSQYLRSIIPKSSTKLICIGTSAGGYGAIRFGIDLSADKIIVFSPQTKINKLIFKRFKSLDSNFDDLGKLEHLDLYNYLSHVSKKKPDNLNIDIHYGSQNVIDSSNAKHIEDFANLYPHSSKSHNIASFLKQSNKLAVIIRGAFESV